MSTSNPAQGVGGTAKDGGLSTAATVADGGPNSKQEDEQYLPEGTESSEAPSARTRAKTSNPATNVGGTAQDGGLSTADTVEDGGPDPMQPDGDFKP